MKTLITILTLFTLPFTSFAQESEPSTKDKINQELLEVIKASKEGAFATVDFVKEQAPDLINQILLWNFTISLIWFLIGLSLLGVTIWGTKKIYNYLLQEIFGWNNQNAYKAADSAIMLWSIPIFGFIISTAIVSNNLTWLKILIAPKLYLFEYIKALL